MTTEPSPAASSGANGDASDRLDSWKDVAAYLRRDVTTVQRWERREGLPIRRHVHDKQGSVYAFRSELDTLAANPHSGRLTPRSHGAQLQASLNHPVRTPRTAACRRCRRLNNQR